MNDMNENIEEFEEDNENYITLADDEGNEASFEIIGTVNYKERIFAVMIPFDEEDDGIVILEIIPSDEPESDEFIAVEDEKLLDEVFEEFKKNYPGHEKTIKKIPYFS